MDLDTDRAIQDIMSGSEFSDVTVITIAYVFFIFDYQFVTSKVCAFFFQSQTQYNFKFGQNHRNGFRQGKLIDYYFKSIFVHIVYFRSLNLMIHKTYFKILHRFSTHSFKRQD